MVKSPLTESKATRAGLIAQASFAMFRILISPFNVETARSRPLGLVWGEFVAIVEARGRSKEMEGERGCKENSEGWPSCHDKPRGNNVDLGRELYSRSTQPHLNQPVTEPALPSYLTCPEESPDPLTAILSVFKMFSSRIVFSASGDHHHRHVYGPLTP